MDGEQLVKPGHTQQSRKIPTTKWRWFLTEQQVQRPDPDPSYSLSGAETWGEPVGECFVNSILLVRRMNCPSLYKCLLYSADLREVQSDTMQLRLTPESSSTQQPGRVCCRTRTITDTAWTIMLTQSSNNSIIVIWCNAAQYIHFAIKSELVSWWLQKLMCLETNSSLTAANDERPLYIPVACKPSIWPGSNNLFYFGSISTKLTNQ